MNSIANIIVIRPLLTIIIIINSNRKIARLIINK